MEDPADLVPVAVSNETALHRGERIRALFGTAKAVAVSNETALHRGAE